MIDNRMKAARKPRNIWYAWYPADYQAKTAHLTIVEDGAYRRLLDHYYQMKGVVVANATILLRVCRAFDSAEQAAVRAVLAEFFKEHDGHYRHERADEELKKREELREKRAAAGSVGGNRKAANVLANATNLLDVCQTQSQSQIRTRTDVSSQSPLGSNPEIQHQVEPVVVCVEQRKPPPLSSKLITSKINRGERWAVGRTVPDEWIALAAERRAARGLPPIDLQLEAETFQNYWTAKAGAAGSKLDWRATWINWTLKTNGANANGKGQFGHGRVIDDHPLGNFAAIADRIRQARLEGRNPFDA